MVKVTRFERIVIILIHINYDSLNLFKHQHSNSENNFKYIAHMLEPKLTLTSNVLPKNICKMIFSN